MEKCDVYQNIAQRTQGDIYIGVVGPVRTGKSTFIKKFMDTMVLPQMENDYEKQRLIDELPQSGDGKTIMTTQPKFVPNEAMAIKLDDNAILNVRMVDCVGYLVEGAMGHTEDEKPRMVTTPWFDTPIPFTQAAEVGTKKVITDHSTIGVVVTTDGSITEIPRVNYEQAEDRVIKELQSLNKPFCIILNSKTPTATTTITLKESMETKYGMPVIILDVMNIGTDDIKNILETVLYEFPLRSISFNLPDWIKALPSDHWLLSDLKDVVKTNIISLDKMRDHRRVFESIKNSEYFKHPQIQAVKLGEGKVIYNMEADKELFYKIVAQESGYEINGEYHLLSIIKELATAKKEYDKIKDALDSVKATGYGLVSPSMDEITLQEPEIIKQGNKYGVKLNASAPSIHMIGVDIHTEVNPIVGSEEQSEEIVKYLLSEFEDNPNEIWDTNIFGKSLHELVQEGLASKLTKMPDDAQEKIQETLEKIINEGSGGLICILL